MENIFCIISVFFGVYSVIQIIFLFKIWEMLNNIRLIREDCVQQNAEKTERILNTMTQDRNEFYVRVAAGDIENAKHILYKEIAKTKTMHNLLKAKNDSTFKKSSIKIEQEFKRELKMTGVHLNFKVLRPQ